MNEPRLIADPSRRFRCECGVITTEGGEAVEHTMHGHKVAIEEKRNGRWRYALGADMHTVAQMMVERLRQRGENVPAFIRRINEEAEAMRLKVEQLEADKAN